jgi:hypothetical protein
MFQRRVYRFDIGKVPSGCFGKTAPSLTNIASASIRPKDKATPYHSLDLNTQWPQIAAAPVKDFVTAPVNCRSPEEQHHRSSHEGSGRPIESFAA